MSSNIRAGRKFRNEVEWSTVSFNRKKTLGPVGHPFQVSNIEFTYLGSNSSYSIGLIIDHLSVFIL